MIRSGDVYIQNQLIGTITETIDGEYVLEYTDAFVKSENDLEMSLTLPKSKKVYIEPTLHAFFDGLIPEGWLLDHAVKNWKLTHQDRMGLLLSMCHSTIGSTYIIGKGSEKSKRSNLEVEAREDTNQIKYSTNKCLITYREIKNSLYEEGAIRKMFGDKKVQYQLSISLADIEALAKEQVGSRLNVTGVQKKLSLDIKPEVSKKRLTIVEFEGDFILKPPSREYPNMPEIEHLCMKMAKIAGFKVPECALIPLHSGELAYIVKRFDRQKGKRFYQEDFCQLLEKHTSSKYKSSIEKCVKIIKKYCHDETVNLIQFFDINFYNFLIGNADMHLKNFSLVRNKKTGNYQMSPCYDFLSTKILVPEDKEEVALSINGKKNKLKYEDWYALALNMGLGEKHFDVTIARYNRFLPKMFKLIDKSFLTNENKELLKDIMKSNLAKVVKS